MRLLPDGIPSLHWIGTAKVIDPIQWTVDQRPFVWAAESKPAEKPPSAAPWTAWTDTFYPGAPLPYSGIHTKVGRSDRPPEIDSSLSLGSSLRTSATTSVPKEIGILQSKVWEPNGREAVAMRSVFCSPISRAASGVDTRRQSLSGESSVVSCTSSPRILIPDVRESSQSTKVPNPIDSWESSMSKEERSRKSSWVEKLIEEDRTQNTAALKGTLSTGSARTGKTSKLTHHKVRHCKNRPDASKKEISTVSKDVSMSESLSDNEDLSDDEGEDGPGVSEKRRKRMLSNRASAQRSRQRRQERLDTLEVLRDRERLDTLEAQDVILSQVAILEVQILVEAGISGLAEKVAELRVQNVALNRRANTAAVAAKNFEEENKILRDRLGKPEPAPFADSNASSESDKTTENSDLAVANKNGAFWRPEIGITKTGDSSEYTDETRDTRYSRESPEPLKRDDEPVARPWNNYVSGLSFDFDFNSDLMDSTAATYRGAPSRTARLENSGSVNVKDLYQSAITSSAQNRSFQGLDPFGIDVEQCNQQMDKKNLDSRSADDIWLDSLAKCLP